MKLTTVLASAAMLGLVYTSGHAGSINVPADLKTAINNLEFLATLATGCNIDLKVYGLEARQKEDCQQFMAQWPIVSSALTTAMTNAEPVIQAADHSGDQSMQLQWLHLADQVSRYIAQCHKAVQHMTFLTDARKSTIKGAKR